MASVTSPIASPDANRIRRNTACTSCRDSKVKCTASLTPHEPCLRCSKLNISCVVDKSHKRMTRRSKLEQLEKEVQSIRDAVARPSLPPPLPQPISLPPPPNGPSPSLPSGPLPPLHLPSSEALPPLEILAHVSSPRTSFALFQSRRSLGGGPTPGPPPLLGSLGSGGLGSAGLVGGGGGGIGSGGAPPLVTGSVSGHSIPEQVPTPSQTTTYTTPTGGHVRRPSEPRALGSRVFSGEDIDYYFDSYFDHFHPYFPVVRLRDPDRCYKQGPILFWVIITVACRHYARDEDTFTFLVESLPKEVLAVSSPPFSLATINALLLLCAWPLPTIRFLIDPSSSYISVALNGCLLLGLHTGRGSHPEFAIGPRKFEIADDEARYTWAGYNIISQRVASANGLPSIATLFNQPVDLQRRSGPPPDFLAYFEVLLEAQKFCSRVSKTIFACTDGAPDGIPEATVRLLEDEYDVVEQTLCRSHTELDKFNLLAVRLEIQSYYFVPQPTVDKGSLRRNMVRAYNTARALVDLALRLDAAHAFLRHAPHFVFRSLLEASTVIIEVLHSVYAPDLDMIAGEAAIKHAMDAMRRTAVRDGDLSARSAKVLESYWSFRHLMPSVGVGMTEFPHRVGGVVVFDCLRRARRSIEEAKRASDNRGQVPESMPTDHGAADTSGSVAPPSSDVASLQDVDWNSLVMDFDWVAHDATFLGYQ